MAGVARSVALGLPLALAGAPRVEWAQTARWADGTLTLLEEKPPLSMAPLTGTPSQSISVDSRVTYQEFVGFGGAFTEAAAINWKKLSKEDQERVIHLYFAPPEEGGHGYTMGRVPINSCDFSPASYSFDDTPGDVDLSHFDEGVAHDVASGVIEMIQAAMAKVEERGLQLKLLASPWSAPAWMKLPVDGEQSMSLSAKPNGLDPAMQGVWAKYISKWLTAYKAQGISMWGVTVQNEPEASAGWESMLWTPAFMATFVRDYLGPVLAADHPRLVILGFDHNKDHLVEWAHGLYADETTKQYLAGMAVHWYGGLNTDKLQTTHEMAPDKMILATEACNCAGNVVFMSTSKTSWWTRAEKLALDILEDFRFWTVGWIDWNLLVDVHGGPNHLKNLCDANIIADPEQTQQTGDTLIKQASFFYMGHFSRYFTPGARRIETHQSVEPNIPPLSPSDIKNGNALSFLPCEEDSLVQRWVLGPGGTIVSLGTDSAPGSDGFGVGGECIEHCLSGDCWYPKVQVWACAASDSSDPVHGNANQRWMVRDVPGGYQLYNAKASKCLTSLKVAGWAVGLDAGVNAVAAQMFQCYPPGTRNQTFLLAGDGDGDGLRDSTFTISGLESSPPLCLQPQLEKLPKFDAVAFKQPDGSLSLVTMNTNDFAVNFTIYDDADPGVGLFHTLPGHAIHTYRWKSNADTAANTTARTVAAALVSAAPHSVPAAVDEEAADGVDAAVSVGGGEHMAVARPGNAEATAGFASIQAILACLAIGVVFLVLITTRQRMDKDAQPSIPTEDDVDETELYHPFCPADVSYPIEEAAE
ncbi:hypothetical protein AB1Y20_015638 [Prymnesium parvum]|uniref:Glucosylceramidase n=1 Tax=Prymnesium parvum TaxID=97485 RepID=A0AB34K111_PRYPA